MRLPNINTRFALPIIHPVTKQEVSAETLYNECCDAMGYQVCDNIGDLVFDNLDYSADETVCATDESNNALHDAIYAWSDSVRAKL